MRAIWNNRSRSLLAIGAVTALLAVPWAPALADNGNPNDKQTICHATSSDTNPYVVNTPNKNGDVQGHADHTGPLWNPSLKDQKLWWGDIIPPFDYNDDGTTKHFAGLNWSTDGQAWFANGCRVPITMTVLKTNNADGNADFTKAETVGTVGADVPFRAVVTNTSVVPAVVTSFVDEVGGNPVTITPTPDIVGTTLAAGASVTVAFTVAGYSPADGLTKTDEVTVRMQRLGDPTNTGSDSDTSSVTTLVPRDVSITKTGPATAVPGDDLTWTLTVRNDSNGVPVSGVTVTDSLPSGTTLKSTDAADWTVSGTTDLTFTKKTDLAVGGTSTITIVATLDPAYAGATVVNTSVVAPTDATPTDNTASFTTTVQRRDVSVVKTGPTAAVAPGATFDWTLTVRNDGPVPVPGVVVTDTLPTGVTLVTAGGTDWTTSGTTSLTFTHVGDLAVGATSTITITVTLDPAYAAPTVVNTAVVAPDDLTPADNTSTVTTDVTTGGGGGIVTPTPTTSTAPFTGGGGGASNLPFTGGPVGLLLAASLALVLSGLGLVLLAPRGRHS